MNMKNHPGYSTNYNPDFGNRHSALPNLTQLPASGVTKLEVGVIFVSSRFFLISYD